MQPIKGEVLRDRFIQTLTEKGIAIRNIRRQGYVGLQWILMIRNNWLIYNIENTFRLYFSIALNICQSDISVSARERKSVQITVYHPARGITSTTGLVAIGPRAVYNIIYKGDTKLTCYTEDIYHFFLVCLKVSNVSYLIKLLKTCLSIPLVGTAQPS